MNIATIRRYAPSFFAVAAFLAFVAWLCISKIVDLDFWGHVAAGRIMWETGDVLRLDPFAYPRAGEPYLAIHEWLAQILLFLVFSGWGAAGVIALRTTIVAATFLTLLSIDWRRAWYGVSLALLALLVVLPGILDRPHLFTYLFFALTLRLCFLYLDRPRLRRGVLLALPLVSLLWANVHGAANLTGILLVAALGAERCVALARSGEWSRSAGRREVAAIALSASAMAAALLLTPAGMGNVAFVRTLLTDTSSKLILEWEPRALGAYAADFWPIVAAAVAALAATRRAVVFSCLSLLLFGYLSRQAFRHEMFFGLLALGVALYSLRWNPRVAALAERLERRPLCAALIALTLFAMAAAPVRDAARIQWLRFDSRGVGAFTPAAAAEDFVVGREIAGPVFNYDWGGYLDYRRAGDRTASGALLRPVFYDGRNVEFGFDFMDRALRAGKDPALWQKLEEEYGFTHAMIWYDGLSTERPIPYVSHLDRNPGWVLVFVDDAFAVYVRNTQEFAGVIGSERFDILTPELLHGGGVPDGLPASTLDRLDAELRQVVAASPEHYKALLLRAEIAAVRGDADGAVALLEAAVAGWPRRYRAYEMLGILEAQRGEWRRAGERFEQALERAGPAAAGVDFSALAEIFGRAGDEQKAAEYRRRAAWQAR